MSIKQIILQEYAKILDEGERNFFQHNLNEIMDAAANIGFGQNETADLLLDTDIQMTRDWPILNNIADVLKMYKIRKLLGSGAVGMAFELYEPHENYVLKIQLVPETSHLSNVGTDYPKEIHARQQTGKYDPREMNVLESIKLDDVNFTTGSRISPDVIKVNFALFVYSRVSTVAHSGKQANQMMTAENAFRDFVESRSDDLARRRRAVEKDPTNFARFMPMLRYPISDATSLDPQQVKEAAERLLKAFNGGGVEAAAGLFYKIVSGKITHLSKEQYILLFKEYYEKYKSAMDRGVRLDFHGGNFGFRKGSDVPLPFDI